MAVISQDNPTTCPQCGHKLRYYDKPVRRACIHCDFEELPGERAVCTHEETEIEVPQVDQFDPHQGHYQTSGPAINVCVKCGKDLGEADPVNV